MTQKTSSSLSAKIGFFQKIWLEVKLVFRLMKDKRVNPFAKLLPLAAFIYWIVPDLVPGPIDDALVMWFGFYLFIELCPPDVVAEHRQALLKVIPGEWHASTTLDSDPQIVEGEFRDLDQ
jgi:uncharacterized membrane protein YkvA (DUF1232 family)